MNRHSLPKLLQRVLILVLAVAMLAGVAYAGNPQNDASYSASYIERLEGVQVDYTDYLDSSVVYQLPEGVSDNEEISVIIYLDVIDLMDAYEVSDQTMSFADFVRSSDEAARVNAAIDSEMKSITAELDEKGIAYTVGDTYNVLLTGFELCITAGDYHEVCSVLGEGAKAMVCEVYEPAAAELVENEVSVFETGIFDSSCVTYDGSGMVVAVLDTGLDASHSAFSMDNFTSDTLGLTYSDVAAVLDDTVASTLVEGLGVDDVYINDKVPYGFDYADKDADVYSTHNNHGTHVSGVIVGNDDTILGVAPNAQLVSMKIFSDTYDSAISSWILSALEDCVVLGVDVINMSLGTAAGFSHESDEEVMNGVYDKIRAAGISMVVAASNSYNSSYGSEANGNLPLTSNPDSGTVGSPSTYDGTLSVASINGVETPYIKYSDTIIYFDESNSGSAEENDFVATLLGDKESAEYEYIVIPGVGRSADYTGVDVTGKIVLVRRGDNTFEEKAMIAEAQGAAGIIIYNNVSGQIKMNVGDAKLAVCSITQDDGEMLVEAGNGKITISKSQTSGPFISDFSSWGPTPSLELKPDLTAHGGNILSAVTGGGYDRLSGTSMACPNLAGVVILLRQYVVENFPEIADNNVEVSNMVNKLMMSTADIIMNTNGLPYSVRKQGAGLANLSNCVETTAYITTYDADGKEMDTPKLELGDDKEKTGVYEMEFTITNFGDKKLTYDLGYFVMTEGVSETKTNAGETTVTEQAYILEGAVTEINSVNGEEAKGTKITVPAGESVDVIVTVTLSDEDKNYLDESFVNGMYVEGYITLTAASGTEIDMSVPFLAFYGDWTKAPMFDLDYFETDADERDDSIAVEDKNLPDAYSTRPIGGVMEDYVSYLGSYYFLQDPEDMIISANRDYIALSNQEGTIHSLRFVWAGLLRSAARIEITITDDVTGEVIFETEDVDVRKSYGDGGSIYPANIEIEFDTTEYNLVNNSDYTVTLVGYMDYDEDGGINTNEKNTFSFPFTVDFEAPTLSDVEFYYEYDKEEKRNRLYAKAAIYDNHYAMSAQLGYVAMGTDDDGNETAAMYAFDQYMTPVYSQEDSTTYVTFELTDYLYQIKEGAINSNSFVLTCYDYALNYATYEIGMPDDYTGFYYDGLEEGITLSPNEVFTLEPTVTPDTEWAELLEFASSKPSVARIVNNKIVAVEPGTATIRIRDPKSGESMTFTVTVLGEEDEGYRRFDQAVADDFTLTGYTTNKAYYMVDSNEKDLGDTGDVRFFGGNYSLSMYPSESVYLNYTLDAYYPKDTTVVYETSNENIVTVDDYGNVTAVAEGFASVTVKVLLDGRSTYYSQTVDVEVKDPYVTNGASLTAYYGLGGLVSIPSDLRLKEIGTFAFANFDYVQKTEEELAIDDTSISKQWYIGEATITKVIIPEGVKKINAYAFANLTALEEVVLPSTMKFIEYGAFYGCSSLETISFSGENNLKIINQRAFESCNLRGTLDLSGIHMISDYAFAGNTKLEEVILSDNVRSIGAYAFAGCKSLTKVENPTAKVKYGEYAFTGCESLESFYVNAAVVPAGMFYECESMTSVTIGPDVNAISEYAFRSTKIDSFEVASGNSAYKNGTSGVILSADGSQLVAVAPTYTGEFTNAQAGGAVTVIARGAFSHNTSLASVVLPGVTVVDGYGFASCESLTSVTLGALTSIGEYAFSETAITEAPAFTADTEIGRYAFSFTKLTSVTIPDGMTIAEGVFSECLELAEVVIGNDVTIGDYAFNVSKDSAYEIEYYIGEKTNEVSVSGGGMMNNTNSEIPEGEDEEEAPVEEPDEAPGEGTSGAPEEEGKPEVVAPSEGEEKKETTRYYYYVLHSGLTSLTIGDNANIGKSAFNGASSLETITLGANAQIGEMAFYNNSSLKEIDLSTAVSIGDYAFSGDVFYICYDEGMAYPAVSSDGFYIYSYHGPQVEKVDLSAAERVGANAFTYCRNLKEIILNSAITELPEYAFAGCIALESVVMPGVTSLGDYAFLESGLTSVDLSLVESIGEYAFTNSKGLTSVIFNPNGTIIGEGAFAECEQLAAAENMSALKELGNYSFAYTAITEADLTGAETLGDQVFLKREFTSFTVTLGDGLTSVGDNPFAMCILAPFSRVDEETGETLTTYDITGSVRVIDGSLYCDVPNGMELIAYAGTELVDVHVADGTVRIGTMAFAGTDVRMVTLPEETISVGHKAFYGCDDLAMVIFGSFYAPTLEEEFDSTYYESFQHIPGTGEFGSYTDYDGTDVTVVGIGLLPYYMWNSTDGMYSNVFYGANFMDYVGYIDEKITMVRPVNGKNYDSYIYTQYFDLVIDGPAAADPVTMATIRAINAIPEKVSLEDANLVTAARAAYSKIATIEQQALVTNYSALISAEQRIVALSTPAEGEEPEEPVVDETPADPVKLQKTVNGMVAIIILMLMAMACGVWFMLSKLGVSFEGKGSEIDWADKFSGAVAAVKKAAGDMKAKAQAMAEQRAKAKAEKAAAGEEEPGIPTEEAPVVSEDDTPVHHE